MRTFVQACEQIAATTKKLQKVAIVADYLKSSTPENASSAAIFLSGRPFPIWEETTLQVGGTLLWRVIRELAGRSEKEAAAAYRRFGDLGSAAEELLPATASSKDLSVSEVQSRFRAIAGFRGPTLKRPMVHELLSQVTPLEAKYIVKIITGDLRIGLKESLVEEAIARVSGSTLREVQRANMLLGDIGETLRLAVAGQLSQAKMRLFHPLGFMLASPVETEDEALSFFTPVSVEHKYDGIRAQAHCSGDQVRIFSRSRDDITESFPELPEALAGLPQDAILDGEILAWSYPAAASSDGGRPLPFRVLQSRIGRKKVSHDLMRQTPVAYLVFDILYSGVGLVLDQPLRERAKLLDELLSASRSPGNATQRHEQSRFAFDSAFPETQAQVFRAPVFQAVSSAELDRLFNQAQAEGNEGLIIKDPESLYTPGRRGKTWLKLKRELARLDVVVTAVEYGHGKRAGVLSDYTFAVLDDDRLVNIGKAYSGLTDVEIAEMTQWFLDHTIEDQGFRRTVEPKVVLEVAFNNIMQSDRHESGYALRFPRIVRLRHDKLPDEADTIQRAKEIYTNQKN